jgi:hypothetical protein
MCFRDVGQVIVDPDNAYAPVRLRSSVSLVVHLGYQNTFGASLGAVAYSIRRGRSHTEPRGVLAHKAYESPLWVLSPPS